MSIIFNRQKVKNVFFGSKKIKKIYKGNNLVYNSIFFEEAIFNSEGPTSSPLNIVSGGDFEITNNGWGIYSGRSGNKNGGVFKKSIIAKYFKLRVVISGSIRNDVNLKVNGNSEELASLGSGLYYANGDNKYRLLELEFNNGQIKQKAVYLGYSENFHKGLLNNKITTYSTNSQAYSGSSFDFTLNFTPSYRRGTTKLHYMSLEYY